MGRWLVQAYRTPFKRCGWAIKIRLDLHSEIKPSKKNHPSLTTNKTRVKNDNNNSNNNNNNLPSKEEPEEEEGSQDEFCKKKEKHGWGLRKGWWQSSDMGEVWLSRVNFHRLDSHRETRNQDQTPSLSHYILSISYLLIGLPLLRPQTTTIRLPTIRSPTQPAYLSHAHPTCVLVPAMVRSGIPQKPRFSGSLVFPC